MSVIRANPANLSEAAQAAQASADRFAELLDRLDQVVRGLKAAWDGAAADGFQAAEARWRASSDDVHAGIRELGRLLSVAESNYTAAEDANLATWRVA